MADQIQDSKRKELVNLQSLKNGLNALEDLVDVRKKRTNNLFSSIDKSDGNFIDYLLDLLKITNGNESGNKIKKILLKKLKEFESQIKQIIFEESIKLFNCDFDFIFTGQTINVRVASIDHFTLLKDSPTTIPNKYIYEKNEDINQVIYPYSTNRKLYDLLQNPSTPFNYEGLINKTPNELFKIQFDGIDNYQVTPFSGLTYINFIKDYYDTIKLYEIKDVVNELFQALAGIISIQKNGNRVDIELEGKLIEVIKKMLSACNDQSDIGVSGTQAIPIFPEDSDESFFDFNNEDLNRINEGTNNKLKGVIKFIDCNNIEIPIVPNSLNSELENLLFDDKDVEKHIDNILDSVLNESNMNNGINFSVELPNIKLDFSNQIIKNFPYILFKSILTPKMLLPIATVVNAMKTDDFNEDDVVEFIKKFKNMISKVIKKILELIIKELVNELKKEIKKIISVLVGKIIEERYKKEIVIVKTLLKFLNQTLETVHNLQGCKNVLQVISSLMKLPPGIAISTPSPLLFAAALRSGFSNTRAFLNTQKKLEALGVPLDNLPDGSPNLFVQSMLALIEGMEDERNENGKIEAISYPGTVINPPLGIGPGLLKPTKIIGIPK